MLWTSFIMKVISIIESYYAEHLVDRWISQNYTRWKWISMHFSIEKEGEKQSEIGGHILSIYAQYNRWWIDACKGTKKEYEMIAKLLAWDTSFSFVWMNSHASYTTKKWSGGRVRCASVHAYANGIDPTLQNSWLGLFWWWNETVELLHPLSFLDLGVLFFNSCVTRNGLITCYFYACV